MVKIEKYEQLIDYLNYDYSYFFYIHTFNGSDTLILMLESLTRIISSVGGWQLLAVDNASSDISYEILRSYGSYDEVAMCLVSKHFKTIRTINRGVNQRVTDINLLKASSIFQSDDLNEIQQLINNTCNNGGWLIFYTHDICVSPSI